MMVANRAGRRPKKASWTPSADMERLEAAGTARKGLRVVVIQASRQFKMASRIPSVNRFMIFCQGTYIVAPGTVEKTSQYTALQA